MRGTMTKTATLSATAALAGALILAGGAATPALAQAAWSLQPGTDATQAPRPSGPVDAQNPVVVRPSTAPDDAPSPQVTLPAAPPPQVKAPAATPSAAPSQAAPRPRASEAPAQPAAQSAARPTAPANATAPSASPPPSTSPVAEAPQPVASPDSTPFVPPAPEPSAAPAPQVGQAAPASHWPEWWLAIPVALLLAAGGIFALLRRRAAPATAWDEAGMEPEPEEEEAPLAPRTAAPEVAAAPRPAPAPVTPPPSPSIAPALAPQPAPLATPRAEVTFEPALMRQSLVYATLVYRMTLTAPPEGLPEGAVIAADMISAHASFSQAEQLAPDPATVQLRHRFGALAPGETREVKGEIQLPLNAIRPVRQGNAALFVPLLRLFLALPDGAIERRVFSLGLPSEGKSDGAGLAPVRIDTGPRDHSPIQAREIDAARSYSGPHPSGDVPQAAE